MKKLLLSNPVGYLWGKMYAYAGSRRKNIVKVTILFVFANILTAVQPLIFAYFLNIIQDEGITKESLAHLFFVLFLVLILEIVFRSLWGPARVMEQKTAFIVKKNYKEHLINGTMSLPLSWHTDHHSGDTIDKIEKGTTSLFSFSENTFQFISAIQGLVISLGALVYFNMYSSVGVLLLSALVFYIIYLYDKKLIPGYRIVNRFENTISAKVYDTISNITTVIILRIERLVFASIRKAIDLPFEQFNTNALDNELKWFWASLLGKISVVFAIAIYLFSNLSAGNVILVGSVYILYSYASKVSDVFFSFAHLYNDSVKWRSRVANAEEISDNFANIVVSNNMHLPRNWHVLSIQNLSFSYHDEHDADLHLDDVSMDVHRGEKIAVIGESGGGKTTFLKLFRGLYSSKTLQLKIDEKLISSEFGIIGDSVSLIPQDPEIFSTSIRENITLGVDYTDREISFFTDMASFTDVVVRLPKGLESSIVEKGVNLSGGEKQRLALARGLLASKDKDIILLDEPTSSVDFHNELQIYENIFAFLADKTIISSIHRLHLLSLFDTIFFFQDGKILASGTLEQLKKTSPEFKELWTTYIKTQNNYDENAVS